MNYQTVQCGRIPLLVRRGGCGTNKKSRSHRSAADGVVAHTQIFRKALRNVPSERPPRPRLFATEPFFTCAPTPPYEEGNKPARNSFTSSKTFIVSESEIKCAAL
jgi:hypothetical protein